MDEINQPNQTNQPEQQDPNTEKLKLSFSWFYKSLKEQIISITNVKQGADIPGTIESITKDTELKGHNIWILGLSILIASIGLNTNSTAIIIGAMLISPLMGPISGLGLALGTNDLRLFVSALRNLGIMVFVAVLTSFLFFKFSPFTEVTAEIASRTRPHFYDALIAIFGGLAGIIGASRKEKSNIIPGVAIATALMPPLCVIGFSLATSHYTFFFGSSYLFLLNTSFIAITSLFVVRTMRFPEVKFMSKRRRLKGRIAIISFAIILLAPSIILFYNISGEAQFKSKAEQFIQRELNFKESFLLKTKYNFRQDSISTIEVFMLGENIDSSAVNRLNDRIRFYGLPKTKLVIIQEEDKNWVYTKEINDITHDKNYFMDLLQQARNDLKSQDQIIDELKNTIYQLEKDSISSSDLYSEISIIYPELIELKGAWFRTVRDSISVKEPILKLTWKRNTRHIQDKEEKVSSWIKLKLKSDTLHLIR